MYTSARLNALRTVFMFMAGRSPRHIEMCLMSKLFNNLKGRHAH
jgi:hypothetical protein